MAGGTPRTIAQLPLGSSTEGAEIVADQGGSVRLPVGTAAYKNAGTAPGEVPILGLDGMVPGPVINVPSVRYSANLIAGSLNPSLPVNGVQANEVAQLDEGLDQFNLGYYLVYGTAGQIHQFNDSDRNSVRMAGYPPIGVMFTEPFNRNNPLEIIVNQSTGPLLYLTRPDIASPFNTIRLSAISSTNLFVVVGVSSAI